MITLYSLASSPSTLAFDQSHVQLTGGSSTGHVELLARFHGARNRSTPPVLADVRAFARQRSGLHRIGMACHILELEPQLDPIRWPRCRSPGPVAFASRKMTQPARSIAGGLSKPGAYSGYFAAASNIPGDTVTVTYTCQFTHNLYLGTSLDGTTAPTAGLPIVHDTLYNPSFDGPLSDRGVAGVRLDNDTETMLDCRFDTSGSELVTRQLLRTVGRARKAHGRDSRGGGGLRLFRFPRSRRPLRHSRRAHAANQHLSRARFRYRPDLQSLALAPAVDAPEAGVRGPDQRVPRGVLVESAQPKPAPAPCPPLRSPSPERSPRAIGRPRFQRRNANSGKRYFPTDTPDTIAAHFADYINSSLIGSWAAATTGGVLTITGRSPALPYNLAVTATVTSLHATAAVAMSARPPAHIPHGMSMTPQARQSTARSRDWHADFYPQCHALGLAGRDRLFHGAGESARRLRRALPDRPPSPPQPVSAALFSTSAPSGVRKCLRTRKPSTGRSPECRRPPG